MGRKTQYEQILQKVTTVDDALSKYLNKKDYTKEDVDAIKTDDQALGQAIQMAKYMYSNGLESMTDAIKEIKDNLVSINDHLNYNLNKDFKGRINGDNPDDMSTKFYGNGNVKPVMKSESHGTHVAGIIAAERNKGIGVNGVANNVEIMPIRTVPNGDEYDKDVALAIRYAVDNGAKVINGSFGKDYSPHSDWVRDAIAYAGKHDVLFVNAAGNDGADLDSKATYPNDQVNNGPEVSNTFITVGALTPKYGPEMVASYSNYGKINVDVFAPGSQIYSTTPENEYKSFNGTSMASPAVAGVAALIRSYYPELTAAQVKQVIMNSGLPVKTKVIVAGDSNDVKPFEDLSKSGKIVNAYNALIVASQMAASM
jgi:subtilisin family serine protease